MNSGRKRVTVSAKLSFLAIIRFSRRQMSPPVDRAQEKCTAGTYRLARYNLSRDTFFGNHCSPTSQRERERSSASPSREREEDQDPIVDNASSPSLHTCNVRVRTRNSVESKGISRSFFIFGRRLGVVVLSISPCIPILSGSIYLRTVGRVGGREGERKIEYLLARGSNKREKGSSKSGASSTREEEGDAKKREREREGTSVHVSRGTLVKSGSQPLWRLRDCGSYAYTYLTTRPNPATCSTIENDRFPSADHR